MSSPDILDILDPASPDLVVQGVELNSDVASQLLNEPSMQGKIAEHSEILSCIAASLLMQRQASFDPQSQPTEQSHP